MVMYCYWTSAKKLSNGDVRVTRYRNPELGESLEADAVVVIPEAERNRLALALLGDTEQLIAEMYDRFHLHADSTMVNTTPANRRAFGDVVRAVLSGHEKGAM